MQRLKLLLCLVFLTLGISAQHTLVGKIVDPTSGEAISFATISLTKSGQKSPVKGVSSDTNGDFRLTDVKNGSYTLKVSYVGYQTYSKALELTKANPTTDLGTIALEIGSRTLNEATVSGERAAIKLEVDRKSYNVAQDLSNVGASATEALENIPSVEVDQDGNISLRGSSSVEVWINGKASGLTAENRATILEQIPAESIDRIEVIDNPGSKYSAEGSAGIINIILKQDRRSGYYGSAQIGADTAGGANGSFNINYNSKWIDVNASIGLRHRHDTGRHESDQTYMTNGIATGFQRGINKSCQRGNNLFTRAGLTLHASMKDDITLTGSFMDGRRTSNSLTPYKFGTISAGLNPTETLTKIINRYDYSNSNMLMWNAELDYRHTFREGHFLNLHAAQGSWGSDNVNLNWGDTIYTQIADTTHFYDSRPQDVNSSWTSVKVDYENRFNERITMQAGYNGDFHHERTPQESFYDRTTFDGSSLTEDKLYYNLFKYRSAVHALYANVTMRFGKFGVQAGLRGEYWHVNTQSEVYQSIDALTPTASAPFKKNYFQPFPSVFLSYQLTPTDQLQLNYTRRLRRPWGGELNSFLDTRDATTVRFGNPELTPEYSNSFSLNYLKTFSEHSFLVSAYYRPTSSVMQRLSYQIPNDNRLFSTSVNLSRSTNTGVEFTLKDKFWGRLDLTTTAAAYYFHLNSYNYDLPNPFHYYDPSSPETIAVSGDGQSRFTWNIRVKASVSLPYDWSIQATGEYRSRQTLTQGYRLPVYGVDLGIKKSFLQKRLVLSMNCRDLLNSRRFSSHTATDFFIQESLHKRHSRKFNFTLTWNFGNTKMKRPRPDMDQQQSEDDFNGGYE